MHPGEAFPGTQPPGALIVDFSLQEGGKESLLFAGHLSLAFCSSSPEGLRQTVIGAGRGQECRQKGGGGLPPSGAGPDSPGLAVFPLPPPSVLSGTQT